MTRIVEETLSAKPLDFNQVETTRSLILPTGNFCLYRRAKILGTKVVLEKTVPNPENINSGIEYYCQVCSTTDAKGRACLQLLAQVSREKAFDFLRTKLQLGYLVWSGVRDGVSMKGYVPSLISLRTLDIESLYRVRDLLKSWRTRSNSSWIFSGRPLLKCPQGISHLTSRV